MSNVLLARAKSDEWHTPPALMAHIRAFLGDDFFDPCPARLSGEPIVNGLHLPWRGHVYVNPPYGRAIVPWIKKAISEPIEDLLLLAPARTDTAWFQLVWAHMDVCFIRGRVRFSMSDNAPFPSMLAYRGARHAAFLDTFSDIGHITPLLSYVMLRERLAVERERQPSLFDGLPEAPDGASGEPTPPPGEPDGEA